MKISQKRLKEVIVEEIEKLQTENSPSEPAAEPGIDQILDWVAEWASKSWLLGTDDEALWKRIEKAQEEAKRRAREQRLRAVSSVGAGAAREGGE